MESKKKTEHTPSEFRPPARPSPGPRKRFRIEKLEERVAPKKGGTHHGCSSATDSIGSGSFY